MAYSSIAKPGDYFNTVLYAGNGSTNNITGVGFQPDWVWIKNRSNTSSHNTFDVVRGATKGLFTNATDAEETVANRLSAFGSDGFTINGDTSNQTNASGSNFVAWNWKAGGAGSSNSDGDITSTVSANTTSGFSIVKWTSNGSNNNTVGHGLGVAPKIVLYKRLDGTNSWTWTYKYVDDTLDYLVLDGNNAKADLTFGTYGFTTSSTISNLGFGNTNEMVAYCFVEKTGFSNFGSYIGNGYTNGTFVYTGFKPAFVINKRIDSTGNWMLIDNKRIGYNPAQRDLRPNLTNVEGNDETFDFLSNGFKVRTTSNDFGGGSGATYIYMAFAEEPLVGTNNVPATAR